MGKVPALEEYVGFHKAFVAIYVIGRAKTRELEEFAYKMGLIEVSEINSKVRPINRGILLNQSPGLLKPLNPTEQFGRQAHFRLENLNEPALAQTEILCGILDSRPGLILREHFQRRRNRVVLFHAVTQATQQSLLERLKALGISSGLTKALPQPAGRGSPKCLQIDVSVGEIVCRESEKRKSAARFEVNSDDKGFFRRFGREALP